MEKIFCVLIFLTTLSVIICIKKKEKTLSQIMDFVENDVENKKKHLLPAPTSPVIIGECDGKYRFENGTAGFVYSLQRLDTLTRSIVPPLDNMTTGGRIIVVGGSMTNPGALFRTAMVAVRLVGVDKVIAITPPKVAPIVKGWSSDLRVYPYLFDNNDTIMENYRKIDRLFGENDIVVIGPGGENETMYTFITQSTKICRKLEDRTERLCSIARFLGKVAAVIYTDDEGIDVFINGVEIPRSKKRDPLKLIVLCNFDELQRIKNEFEKEPLKFTGWFDFRSYGVHKENQKKDSGNRNSNSGQISTSFVMKGRTDYFMSSNLKVAWARSEGGTGVRAAGQGDIFAGVMAVFLNWATDYNICGWNNRRRRLAESVSAYAASVVTRRTNEIGVEEFARGLTSTRMLRYVREAFIEEFVNTKTTPFHDEL